MEYAQETARQMYERREALDKLNATLTVQWWRSAEDFLGIQQEHVDLTMWYQI